MNERKKMNTIMETNQQRPGDRAHVTRYFSGKAPKWAEGGEGEEKENHQEERKREIMEFSVKQSVINDNMSVVSLPQMIDDRRLRRIQQAKAVETEQKTDEKVRRRREIYQTEIIDGNQNKVNPQHMHINKNEEVKPQQNDGLIENYHRRQIPKESKNSQELKQNTKEDDDIFAAEDINIPDIEDKIQVNNEELEDEDEEKLLRPVFVSKDERITIKEKLQKELEEKANKELEIKMKEMKKKETKKLVLSYIQKEINGELEEKNAEEDDMPDDTDDPDNVEEYEQWKIRELKRIKRNEEENMKKLKEKEEIERRRALTDEQRNEENLRLGSDDTLRPFKSKYKFMQKYYTMGVFFKDDAQGKLDHIYNRDYNLGVGEDNFDKSSLPSVLQKRRGLFGKKGQTKYTHLTNEDTTCHDPLFKVPENISHRLTSTLGGYKGKNEFDKPGGRKK